MMAAWFHTHRRSLFFFLILLAIGGLLSITAIPVALFPKMQFPRIRVMINLGDKPTQQMVAEITRPAEEALRSVPGIRDIHSDTGRGSSELIADFSWGHNMTVALLQVKAAINQILPNLPAQTTFSAMRMGTNIDPVYGLSLTSNDKTLVQLHNYAEYHLKPLLSAIPGVSEIRILGGDWPEYQVVVDKNKLRALGLSYAKLENALTSYNKFQTVGEFEDHHRLYLIVVDNQLKSVKNISDIPLKIGANDFITLGQIATIKLAHGPNWTRVTANRHNAVLVNIIQQVGGNTVDIVKQVKQRLKANQNQIPAGITIKPYYDQSLLIMESARSVRDAIIIGAILASVVLLLFLRDWRMMLIIIFFLPCVLAITILLLRFLNMSFNIMTLGGMAAAVGLIMDDCVVLLEHIIRTANNNSKSNSRALHIYQAALQMAKPLTGSSLATMIIFLPLAFLAGIAGGFFKALAITMTAALIVSYITVLISIPILSNLLMHKKSLTLETEDKFLTALKSGYRWLMHLILTRIWATFAILGVIIVLGGMAYMNIGSGFMPKMDEGGFVLDYIMPAGTSLTETNRVLEQVGDIITSFPQVESYSRRTGLQMGGGITEPNTGDFFIKLKNKRKKNIYVIMRELRQQIYEKIPGLQIDTAQLMNDMIGDLTAAPQPIAIKIYGDDQNILRQTAKQIATKLKTIPGVVEINNGITISGDTINIKVNAYNAALFDLSTAQIINQVRTQIYGTVATYATSPQALIGIRVHSTTPKYNRIAFLKSLKIRTPEGKYIPLNTVATIKILKGQAEVTRENLSPMIAVTADIDGRDLGSTMQQVKAMIAKMNLPAGFYVKYGGLYKTQQKSFHHLLIVFVSALLLLTLLLLYLYEKWTIVFSIIATALLSLSGVFIGLWLTGTELNLSSMMGLTMILGIVTEIAIFYFSELVTHKNHTQVTIIQSGLTRLRPILITVIIAILALLPLALGIGRGSAMQRPLAIAIISGLIMGLPLVLVLMPNIYLSLQRISTRN